MMRGLVHAGFPAAEDVRRLDVRRLIKDMYKGGLLLERYRTFA